MVDPTPALDADGWFSDAIRVDSPNHDARPVGESVSLVVIHAISLPPGQFGGNAVGQLFTNCLDAAAHPYFATIQGLRVSAHFFIRRDGELIQFVSTDRRAWHAGVSCWRGRQRCNDFSIGIELEGDHGDHGGAGHAYEEAQYCQLVALIHALRQRYPIGAIVGHCDVAAGRKSDPGPRFDWLRLSTALDARVA